MSRSSELILHYFLINEERSIPISRKLPSHEVMNLFSKLPFFLAEFEVRRGKKPKAIMFILHLSYNPPISAFHGRRGYRLQ